MLPLALAALAAAADAPFFQTGGRLGLVPPPGLSARLECLCFMSDDLRATIFVSEAPDDSFAQADAGGVAGWKDEGMTAPKREDVTVDGHRAILISGAMRSAGGVRQHVWALAVDTKPRTVTATATVDDKALRRFRPDAIRRALLGARLRPREVALAEHVEMLRLTLADHAGFRLAEVLPGRAVMLTEGPADAVKAAEQPVVWVLLGNRRADTDEARAALARELAREPALVSSREVAAVGYRRDGVDWHRLERTGAHPETGEPLRAIQVVRFHADGFLWVRATLREADAERLTPRVLRLAHSAAPR